MPHIRRSRAILAGTLWIALAALPLSRATAAGIPSPPRDRAHRFGVYAWGFDDSSYSPCEGCPDRLGWVADKVASTGSRTIRVYLGARDDYRVNPPQNAEDEGYLVRIVAGAGYPLYPSETAYSRLFSDSRFDTYLLTVYTPADNRGDWMVGWTQAGADQERAQIAALGNFLLRTYPKKTFLFLNWEGDNAIHLREGDRSAWDAFITWTRSRVDGVRAAQAANRNGAAHLLVGLEFNLVQKNGAACGADGALEHRCVLDYVAPKVDVDYYSYSAWQTLNVKAANPGASLKSALASDLGFALGLLKRARPELKPANFLLGEVGFARTAPNAGECRAASYVQEIFGALEGKGSFGVSYAIYWQVLDNPPGGDVAGGTYGLFRGTDGGPTLAASIFHAAVKHAKPPAIPRDCPKIDACRDDPSKSCGVVNASAWTPDLSPGSTLAIFGAHFSAGGNRVQVIQGPHHYVLPRDEGNSWFESAEQINAALPGTLTSGPTFVYVTDARGLDSNGQPVDLEAAHGSSPAAGGLKP